MQKENIVAFVIYIKKDIAFADAETVLNTFSPDTRWRVDFRTPPSKYAFGWTSKEEYEKLFDTNLEWHIDKNAPRTLLAKNAHHHWVAVRRTKVPSVLKKIATRIHLQGRSYLA